MLPPAITCRKAQYLEMAQSNQVIEDKYVPQGIKEHQEIKRSTPEYIDSLMKKYGFKAGDEVESG